MLTISLKMTLFKLIYHLFTKTHCFKPIESFYVKVHDLCFNDFNILFKTLDHWKIDFLKLTQTFLNLTFNEHFLCNKNIMYNFPL